MNLLQVDGIVLKALPFKDYDKIITLFTPQEGVVSLFVKGSKKKALELSSLTTPFTAAEYLYTQGKTGMGKLQEGKLLNQHLALRNSLVFLQAADCLSKAIVTSQWPGKPAPQLYSLFRFFLEKIPEATFPLSLSSSFLLKILKHDGLLQIQPSCCLCQIPIKEGFRLRGERFCSSHRAEGAIFFSEDEETIVSFLAHCRSIAALSSLPLEDSFFQKIFCLFEQAVS